MFNLKNILCMILITFFLTIIISKIIIKKLRLKKIGQMIRELGPKNHYDKKGTPTMGGIIFIISSILMLIFTFNLNNITLVVVISMLLFGSIGFIDDYFKLIKKTSLGLNEKQKLILQFLFGIICISFTEFILKIDIRNQIFPFLKKDINLGLFIYPIQLFVFVATANATNLTDGLDGLLTGVSIPVFITLGIFGYLFNIPEITIFCIIFTATLFTFLIFNSNPASIFMGDTGSMAIGGAIAGICMVLRINFLLIIFGMIYIVEVASVIIQSISFKTRGKKIFKMSPIHHHFELKGYKEQKIVVCFSAISVILCIFSIISVLNRM